MNPSIDNVVRMSPFSASFEYSLGTKLDSSAVIELSYYNSSGNVFNVSIAGTKIWLRGQGPGKFSKFQGVQRGRERYGGAMWGGIRGDGWR